jgi:hypothetical protein
VGDALAPEPNHIARSCSWVDRNQLVTIECLNRDLSSESCLSERNREFINEIIVPANEPLVFGNANVHVEIARGSIPRAHCASSRQSQCLAGIDTRRNIDGVLAFIEMTTLTSACRAWTIDDGAEAIATTARPSGDHLTKN